MHSVPLLILSNVKHSALGVLWKVELACALKTNTSSRLYRELYFSSANWKWNPFPDFPAEHVDVARLGALIPFSSYFQALVHSGKHMKSFSKTKSLALGILYYCYSNLCVIAVLSNPIDFNRNYKECTISYTRASHSQIYGFPSKVFPGEGTGTNYN